MKLLDKWTLTTGSLRRTLTLPQAKDCNVRFNSEDSKNKYACLSINYFIYLFYFQVNRNHSYLQDDIYYYEDNYIQSESCVYRYHYCQYIKALKRKLIQTLGNDNKHTDGSGLL